MTLVWRAAAGPARHGGVEPRARRLRVPRHDQPGLLREAPRRRIDDRAGHRPGPAGLLDLRRAARVRLRQPVERGDVRRPPARRGHARLERRPGDVPDRVGARARGGDPDRGVPRARSLRNRPARAGVVRSPAAIDRPPPREWTHAARPTTPPHRRRTPDRRSDARLRRLRAGRDRTVAERTSRRDSRPPSLRRRSRRRPPRRGSRMPSMPSSAVGRSGAADLEVIEATSGHSFLRLPVGAPDASWGHVLSTSTAGGSTIVRTLVVEETADARELRIDGDWQLPTRRAGPGARRPVGRWVDLRPHAATDRSVRDLDDAQPVRGHPRARPAGGRPARARPDHRGPRAVRLRRALAGRLRPVRRRAPR